MYPALAIAEALAADPACAPLDVLYVGTRDRLEARIVPKAGLPIAFVRAAPLSRGFSARDPFAVARTVVANAVGFVQSLAILHRARPDVLIATGGYVALPVVAALRFVRLLGRSRARIALLEPNAVAGIANRLLGPLVDETWFSIAPGRPLRANERVVGTPVRSSMRAAMDVRTARFALGLAPDVTTIVAMGGSQGAASLNHAVAGLAEHGLPPDRQVLLIAGERAADAARARLRDTPRVRVVGYLDDPRAAYAAADVVIARAGASTLGELAATATPALLVPYPHATADHQRRNAEAYATSGAARVVADRDVSAQRLAVELAFMLAEPAFGDLRAAAAALARSDPRAAIVARVKVLSASNMPPPVRLSPAVHFVGISGIGMSALARVLMQRGYRVTGSSDRRTELTDRLEREGARVFVGHAATNVGAAGTLVVSSAIAPNNPEIVAARERDVEIVHRGQLLALLMQDRRGIAIAGTHGKTTTTAMTARVLEAGGLDPTVIVGGERLDTSTNASDGKGAWLVSEADESDMSFLDLRPEIAVVTNVENDHISSDAELPRLIRAFEHFASNLPRHGLALFGIDEPRAASLAERPRPSRTQTFGFGERANVRAVRATYRDFGSRFDVLVDDAFAGEIALGVPGAINVLDALPAVAIGLELGVPFRTMASALDGFRGVRRRFEILARTPRMMLVDDYAHHPTAVSATIAAARENFAGPIVVAFQPHRYSRTQYLAGEFARALRGADRVILTDVYGASEAPLPGVDARVIGAPLEALGNDVAYLPNVADLPEYVLEHAPDGALVLALGAGSITAAAAELARRLLAPGDRATSAVAEAPLRS